MKPRLFFNEIKPSELEEKYPTAERALTVGISS